MNPPPVPQSLPDTSDPSLTPAMRQYVEFKREHPEYVLFFRMGDFYEMFWDDARLASRVLGVTLTTRSRGGVNDAESIPMAGVPFHSVTGYLRRMIAAGHKVAICEQTEEAGASKGVIRREVTRLVSAGTLVEDELLDGEGRAGELVTATAGGLAAVAFGVTKRSGYRAGVAWVDLSTGAVLAANGTEDQIAERLRRLEPAEVLSPELPTGEPHAFGKSLNGQRLTTRPGRHFTPTYAADVLREQWGVASAAGFGFDDDDPAIGAVSAAVTYLRETQGVGDPAGLSHLRPPTSLRDDATLAIDAATFRSLEIDRTAAGAAEGSLLHATDRTVTPAGKRLLRQWLRFPLRGVAGIEARQNAVGQLLNAADTHVGILRALRDVCDVERVVARIAVGRVAPRDVASLARCLAIVPGLVQTLRTLSVPDAIQEGDSDEPPVSRTFGDVASFAAEWAGCLASAVQTDPAPHLREGGVIADGHDAELDRLRHLATHGQTRLIEYQATLASETGIERLKVGYTKVFGYYIEVSDAYRDRVPAAWHRKQTVKGAERYVTDELKAFETEVLTARERAVALEAQLFERLRRSLLPHLRTLQSIAGGLARLDVLTGLATLATERRYVRPTVTDGRELRIVAGRHPVLEQKGASGFVANDVTFDADDTLQVITGPNMAGKSTFIRQTALLTILAQTGSWVPAERATIGVADQVFARIGASDEIHDGRSTFMVEMTETAHLLNAATDRSLIILDEIGRGTGTLDGLSLAWAIAEHIAQSVRARTLFATHYHELTGLSGRLGGVKNLHVAVREQDDEVIFLYRILEGGTDRSYGLHVARMAGVPGAVLRRAGQLLGELTVHHTVRHGVRPAPSAKPSAPDAAQLALFPDPAADLWKAFASIDLDRMSPVDAFDLLRAWKRKYVGDGDVS